MNKLANGKYLVLFAVALFSSSCTNMADQLVEKSVTDRRSKDVITNQGPTKNAKTPAPIEFGSLEDAIQTASHYEKNYRLTVDLNDQAEVCETNFKLSIPIPGLGENKTENQDEPISFSEILGLENITVTCLDTEIPIGTILDTFGDTDIELEQLCPDQKTAIAANEQSVSIKQLLCLEFSPAVPLAPAILAGSKKQLKELNINQPVSITIDSELQQQANVSLMMTDFEAPYQSSINPNTQYARTMAWKFSMQPANPGEVLSLRKGGIQELSFRIDMDNLKVISLNLKVNVLDEIQQLLGDQGAIVQFVAARILGEGNLSFNVELED